MPSTTPLSEDYSDISDRKVEVQPTLQRKISFRKQVSFDDKSCSAKPPFSRDSSADDGHPMLGRRRSSSVKRNKGAANICKDESYVIKSNRTDVTTEHTYHKKLDEVNHSRIDDTLVEVSSDSSDDHDVDNVTRPSETQDFWDAFEEDDAEDEVFSEHQICYTPCDIVVTSAQLIAAALLMVSTMLTMSFIQLCVVALTRSVSSMQEQAVNTVVILSAYLVPSLVCLPYLLYKILYQRSYRSMTLSQIAVIGISVALDVYSLFILIVCLISKLDVCESLLILTSSSCCSQLHRLVVSNSKDRVTPPHSLLDRNTLAAVVQVGTTLCLAIKLYITLDFYTALLIPSMLISSGLSELLKSFSQNNSQKGKNTATLAATIFKVIFIVLFYGIFIDTPLSSLQIASVPTYVLISGVGLCLSPLLFHFLISTIRIFKLSKGASTALGLTTPLTLLAAILISLIVSPDVCLYSAPDSQCLTLLTLTNGFTINWKILGFLIGWFWSYLTLTSMYRYSNDTFSSLCIQKADSYAFASFNSTTNHTEKMRNLSMSALPMYRNNVKVTKTNKVTKQGQPSSYDIISSPKEAGVTPKLYLCATLWHENKVEMKQFLTSTFKLDEYQCMKRQTIDLLAHTDLDITDPEYFEFETHIMFDDAMTWNEQSERSVNCFVSEFIEVVQETAQSVQGAEADNMEVPEKYPAPYGGQLKFTLPGGNLLVVHLKDKLKIRNKKRWSMIQYMYYLLGYRLLSQHPEDYGKMNYQGIPCKTKQEADNTFLLTVDGDVQFEPISIQQLMRQLKKSDQVGVVCGRIHPMGSGLLVWYQRFEYAIAHWLHKTAENVMGVVLCTPGAFSMFKASALMDRNVVKTFTREVKTGTDALQYEQGEDRWLCSLLFQQGHRCEYVPSASARTYAPQTMLEFFNQRRRWALSSVVNQYDLLTKWRNSYLKNKDISVSYILFEAMLFLTTVLGPSYVLIFLAYANATVFELDLEVSYFFSVLPPIMYTLLSTFLSRDNQVKVAYILSLYYGSLTFLYFVLNLFTMVDYNLTSPLILMMIVLGSLFALTAILHPREIGDLLPVTLYYLMIPTTYMILMIYCVLNLNIISWGTREMPVSQKKSRRGSIKARDDLVNPSWVESSNLDKFELKYLDENELLFWRRLIKSYLKPHSHSDDTKATLQADLLALRNKTTFFYYLLNAMAVYLCYIMQKYSSYMRVVSSDETNIEPVALMYVVMFGLLALAQFVCLVYLKAGKLTMYVATTLRLRKSSTTVHPDLNTAQSIVEHLKRLKLAGTHLKMKSKDGNMAHHPIANLSDLIKTAPADANANLLDV